MNDEHTMCLIGAKRVCGAVGENPKRINTLVKDGLPAWKRDGYGTWMALPEDIKAWLIRQRDKHLGQNAIRSESPT